MRIRRLLLPVLLAVASHAVAGDLRWAVSPSTAACLGITESVDDLYVLEIPRAANIALELAPADGGLLLMAADDETAPRTIATSSGEPMAMLLAAGRYYVGVAGSSPYQLTISAPELLGSATVDLTEKMVAGCVPDARTTIAVAEVTERPPAILETRTEEIGIAATTPKRHRSAIPPKPCTFNVSATSQSVTNTAGSGSVGVTATRGDCGWGARSNTSWLTVTGAAGAGNGDVSYSFVANTSSSSRTGTLTVAGRTVSITQFGACSYTLSPTSREHTSAGGTGTFSVSTRSDCAWTAAVSTAAASWLTITGGQSGTGNGTVSYSVAAHTSTSARSGTITAGGRTFSVNQGPDISSCTYTPAYTSKTVTWCGGERTIEVTTQGDCPWTATSDSSWLTIVLPSRTGTRTLSYTVAANTTGSPREAKLTIAGTQVRIIQNPRAGSGTYDGNWTGTTSSNRAVSLCVAENAIQNVSISVRLEFITFSCITPLIRQQELAITGSTFSGTFTTYPEVSNVFTTVRGTFTSPSAMNGSWDAYSQSYFIICGSTFGFGTGGTILFPGTFTATKQP